MSYLSLNRTITFIIAIFIVKFLRIIFALTLLLTLFTLTTIVLRIIVRRRVVVGTDIALWSRVVKG